MSMKNLSATIGNRTLNLPGCSKVPQPIRPLLIPLWNRSQLFKLIVVPTVREVLEVQNVAFEYEWHMVTRNGSMSVSTI
jgi:hypothetical protein